MIGGLNLLHIPETILNCSAVTTTIGLAPSYNWSICQNGSKCCKRSKNLLNILQLSLNTIGAATKSWMSPCKGWSILQNGIKSPACRCNSPDGTMTVWHRMFVKAKKASPCHNWSICQNCSKTFSSTVDFLGPQSCHHHFQLFPMSPLTHLPIWQQMHTNWLQLIARSWAELGLQSCRHLHHAFPKWWHHCPGNKLQMRLLWPPPLAGSQFLSNQVQEDTQVV